ncbi:MAG: hypothetical protein ACRDZV_05755, partial [Acidimicrobiia bacterium]
MRTMSAATAIGGRGASRRALPVAMVTAALLLAALLGAAPARAEFGLLDGHAGFDGGVFDRDAEGNQVPATQAGAHPFKATTTFRLNETEDKDGFPIPDGQMRNVHVELPRGFIGNPTAVPKCDPQDLIDPYVFSGDRDSRSCSTTTQVGFVELLWAGDMVGGFQFLPIYNMEPPPGAPAQFAFNTGPGGNVVLTPSVRSDGDYGIDVDARNISQALPIVGSKVTFWGVPADDSHDGQRGACLVEGGSCPVDIPLKPFLSNPTDCSTGPVRTHIQVESWAGQSDSAFFDTHDVPPNEETLLGPTGCERLEFDPSIRVQPTSTLPDSPTGLDVELTVPQTDDPDGLATAHLEKAVVTLPEGMTVNPSSADGLQACSPAQIALDSRADPTCPEASKIGSVEIDTPLLEDPLKGAVYVAQQNENPFRSLLAIYIVAKGPG